jgi:phosphoribosylpyrophosphate synthetase
MLAGTSNPDLAVKIAEHLRTPLMKLKCGRFPDGAQNPALLQLGETEMHNC